MTLHAILEAKWRLTQAVSNLLRVVMDMHGGQPVNAVRLADLVEEMNQIKHGLHEAAILSVKRDPPSDAPVISPQQLSAAFDQIDDAVRRVERAESDLRAGVAALDRARAYFDGREE